MKKIITFLMFAFAVQGHAQVRNYTFSQQESVSYDEITDGTLLTGSSTLDDEYFADTNTAGSTSVKTGAGIDIGFNFVFNGATYNRFGISNEGWISLGQSSLSPAVDLTVQNPYGPLSSNSSISDVLCSRIAALAVNLQGQTGSSLRYKLVTASPNNYLVIQWKNYRKKNSTSDSYNFQIRLYQNTNEVKIVYGDFSNDATASTVQVGLRAEPATTPQNNNFIRTSTGSWLTSALGAYNSTMALSNTNKPSSGLAFTFTPPSCGSLKDFSVSNVATTSATVAWGVYAPTPTPQSTQYEYIYSKSSAVPAATASGTVTSLTTADLSGLDVGTLYYFFIRIKCDSQVTDWVTAAATGLFKTKCLDQTSIFETFDASANVPDCWSGSAMTINNGSATPGTAPNRLSFGVVAGTSNYSYVIMPPVSNLASDTYRLRFKALANSTSKSIDVGYFSDANQTVFVSVWPNGVPKTLPSTAASPAETLKEFTITPGAIQNAKSLVFRIGGTTSPYITYLDDVVWEPKTVCADVKAITAKQVTNNSAVISWTAGNTETKWQYAFSAVETNPYKLTAIDVPGTQPTLNLANLSPATTYKFWIRSVCSATDNGAWIGPVIVVTACDATATMLENFDSSTALPSCWSKITLPTSISVLVPPSLTAPSPSNVLQLDGASRTTIVMLKPLSTLQAGTHRIKFKLAAPVTGKALQIGYLTDVSDGGSFQSLRDVAVTAANVFELKSYTFGTVPTSNYLAFKAVDGVFYIDDVIWEPNPDGCTTEITEIAPVQVNNNSAILNWKQGNSSAPAQYVVGSATDLDPNALTAKNFVNPGSFSISGTVTGTGTIDKLSPSTAYKVWIRLLCDASHPGAYAGPYNILTTCDGLLAAIDQNFDASTSLPACWYKAGNTGTVTVNSDSAAPSAPNVVMLTSTSTTGPAILAFPPISNQVTDNYSLTFRYKTPNTGVSPSIEIGYLKNLADSSISSFVPLGEPLVCDNTYKFADIKLEEAPGTNVLAIRWNNTSTSSILVNIDDVKWATVPKCLNVSGLKVDSQTHSTINFSWVKGNAETKWEYVIGNENVSDPKTLTPKEISGIPKASVTQLSDGSPLLPTTKYKIWVRSKCLISGTYEPGNYVGALDAVTDCAPQVEFLENFNASYSLPLCWKLVNTLGANAHLISNTKEPNDGRKLYLTTPSGNALPLVSMPPIDSASFADHVLKFRMIGDQIGAAVEVGYVAMDADTVSFVPMATFNSTSAASSDTFTYKFLNPVSNVIGFRVPSGATSGVYLDDVAWMDASHLSTDDFNSVNFSYYPNPVKDILNLSYNQEMSNVTVVNLLGQQVISKALNAAQGKMDMSHLPVGAYFVRVTIGNQLKTVKVIKE